MPHPYVRPQETGNRENCRWMDVLDDNSKVAVRVRCLDVTGHGHLMGMQVSHVNPEYIFMFLVICACQTSNLSRKFQKMFYATNFYFLRRVFLSTMFFLMKLKLFLSKVKRWTAGQTDAED